MNIRQTLAQWFYSPGAYGLWLALEDAENWSFTQHTASYWGPGKRSRAIAVMWLANGRSHFDGYESEGTPKFLGWYERRWLWRKMKKLNNHKMLFRFTRLEDPK